MTIVGVIHGDILDTPRKYIAHQTNCCTIKAHGLSQQIFNKYPEADVYFARAFSNRRDSPGSVQVTTTKDGKTILNLMGQFAPGKADGYFTAIYNKKLGMAVIETTESRLDWFRYCVYHVDEMHLDDVVAIPYNVGCGLAGGNWGDYKQILDEAKTNFELYSFNPV